MPRVETGSPYYSAGGVGQQPELPPASWTHFYWPAALLASVAGFTVSVVLHRGNAAWALWAGVALLGAPEVTVAILRRWQDTFSVWVWNTLRITQGQPIRTWDAEHFLMLGAYLVLAATICAWVTAHEAVGWTVASCFMSVWLAFHFFWRIWT